MTDPNLPVPPPPPPSESAAPSSQWTAPRAPAATASRREPGSLALRWGIGLCLAALLVAGVVAGVGFQRIGDAKDRLGGFPSVAAGEEARVRFDDAGGMTAYFESTCFECDGSRRSAVSQLSITDPDGEALPIEVYASDGTASASHTGHLLDYSHDGYEGEPEYTFRVPTPGTYVVAVGESREPDARMVLGPSVVGQLAFGVVLIIAGVAAGGLLLVLGLVVLIVAFVRRRSRRRRSRAAPG